MIGVHSLMFTKTPPELQLKVEHSGKHLTFLNLDMTIKDGVFICKLFDKHDAFPFFIVCMPYIDSNISKSIFCSALVGEFLRTARSSLLYKEFHEKAMELRNRMKAQGHNPSDVEKHYPKSFEDMKKRLQIWKNCDENLLKLHI